MKISQIKGIGPKKEKLFKLIGVETSNDLLHIFPKRYIDKSHLSVINEIVNNSAAVIRGTIIDLKEKRNFNKKDMIQIKIESDGYIGDVIFFNAHYMKNNFKFQKDYYFYGKIEKRGMTFKMVHPEFSPIEDENFLSIEPSYSLPDGISQRNMRQYVSQQLKEPLQEILPEAMLEKRKLCSREYAYQNIHFPTNRISYKEAKYRLIYEEFFYFTFGNRLLKNYHLNEKGERIKPNEALLNELVSGLEFQLTQDQKKVFKEIQSDLESTKKMNRLLQGDVGSGKTIVAILSAYQTILSGYQAAVMVPTEILANQHFESFRKILPDTVKIELLTGAVKNKNEIYKRISENEIHIVIGTHALIQDKVIFNHLGLIVTDEQHRFGVNQRKSLTNKNIKANYLMMSATPIPRTMSLILYSDIDISTIVEMPKGRKKIITSIGQKTDQIKSLLDQGQQGYIVFPLIEESEFFYDVQSIQTSIGTIEKEFSDYRISVVHGQMKVEERENVIHAFKNKAFDLLIATTVIEVGIDVPNASFMVIYNAERFGLSQLHQLRGRVGRGSNQSYCYLVANGKPESNERLKALVESNDGFYISRKDLEIRGPGEVLGIRQHGSNHFLIADFFKHLSILEQVSVDLDEIFDNYEEFGEYINQYRKEISI